MSVPPIGQQAQAPAAPQPANPPPAPGFWGRLGDRAFNWALAHEQAVDLESFKIHHPECSKVIQNISHYVIEILVKESDNNDLLIRGSPRLEATIIELTEAIFLALGNNVEGDEALIDQVVIQIITAFQTEFAASGGALTKDSFRRIANQLFTIAFSERGVNDPRVPKLLRNDTASIIARTAIRAKVGVDVSWDGVQNIFATFLEQVYNSLTKARVKGQEAGPPGLDELLNTVVAKLQEQTAVDLTNVTFLDDDSKAFLSKSITHILTADNETISGARNWIFTTLKTSIKAICTTIFGNGDEKRLNEFADKLIGNLFAILPKTWQKVKSLKNETAVAMLSDLVLPTLQAESAKVKLMDQKALTRLYTKLIKECTHANTRELLQKTLAKLQPATLNEAKEVLLFLDSQSKEVQELIKQNDGKKAKEFLASLEVTEALEGIFQDELKPENFQPLLPDFLSAKVLFRRIYGLTSGYILDIMDQANSLQLQGVNAEKALTRNASGKRVARLVNQGLGYFWELFATKAKAKTIEPSDYQFINNFVNILFVPETLEKFPGVKVYIDSLAKNIIYTVLRDAVGKEGLKKPEQAIAGLIDATIKRAQDAVTKLLAREDLTEEELKLELDKAALEIISGIIKEEQFTALLPKFLAKFDLYSSVVTLFSDKVLHGLYLQAKQLTDVTQKKYTLPEEVKPALTPIYELIQEQLEKQEKGPFASVLSQLGILAQKTIPTLVESILAYHIHEEPSEKHAATLLLQVANITQRGFERAKKAPQFEEWSKSQDQAVLAEYRKANDIPPNQPFDVKDYILQETSQELFRLLLPQEVQQTIIPQKYLEFNIDKKLAGLCYSYIRQAYNYSEAVSELEAADKDIESLQNFVIEQIELAVANPTTWEEKVVKELMAQAKGSAQNMQFLLNFGALGLLVRNATGKELSLPENLLETVKPIVTNASEGFKALNEKANVRNQLGISPAEIKAYKEATHKEVVEDAPLVYWVLARRTLENIPVEDWKKAIPIFSKDTAATLAMKLYETAHKAQAVLVEKEAEGRALVQQQPGLTQFINEYLVKNLEELLVTLGQDPNKLTKVLPDVLDKFVKGILKDEEVSSTRNLLLNRVIFTALYKLLSDEKKIPTKVQELIESYNQGNNSATAKLALDMILPEEIGATTLGKTLLKEALPETVSDFIEDIRVSQSKITEKAQAAEAYINSLEGLNTFVKTSLDGLGETLRRQAEKKEPLSKILPPFVDAIVKELLQDKTFNPVLAETLRKLGYIVLQQVLTPKKGQSIPDRVYEVLNTLIRIYRNPNPDEAAATWLKLLLPEEELKELLPEFLQSAITYEKLVKWFIGDYMKEIIATVEQVKVQAVDTDNDIKTAQSFVNRFLQDYTEPTAPKEGLIGFGGHLRDIEQKILKEEIPELTTYIDATVSDIIRTLQANGSLSPDFLSNALSAALPMLNAPPPVPSVQDITNALLLKLFGEQGERRLLVPDVIKSTVWEKLQKSLNKLFTELTTADTRVQFVLERLISMTSDDKVLVRKRLDELHANPKNSEKLFRAYTEEVAIKQLEAQRKPGFFNWITHFIIKAATILTLRLSLNKRLYAFISSPASDDKIKHFLLAIMQKQDVAQDHLKPNLKKALKANSLAPFPIRGILASAIQSTLKDQTILSFL